MNVRRVGIRLWGIVAACCEGRCVWSLGGVEEEVEGVMMVSGEWCRMGEARQGKAMAGGWEDDK